MANTNRRRPAATEGAAEALQLIPEAQLPGLKPSRDNCWMPFAGCTKCSVTTAVSHPNTVRYLRLKGNGQGEFLAHCGNCGRECKFPWSNMIVIADPTFTPDAMLQPTPRAEPAAAAVVAEAPEPVATEG